MVFYNKTETNFHPRHHHGRHHFKTLKCQKRKLVGIKNK